MTLNDIQRAALALFAAREAGPSASLEQMKGICYVIRNRVRAGWFDGNWITVMEHADEASGNMPAERFYLDLQSRSLQRLFRDIDDIYYGGGSGNSWTPEQAADLETAVGKQLYWMFIDRPHNPWFVERILRDPENHPNRAQAGTMMFYE